MSTTAAATDLLRSIVQRIIGDPAEAQAYSQNPAEYLAAHGVADHDLSDVDIRPLIVEAAASCGLPETTMAKVDAYGKGESPAPGYVGDSPAPATSPAPGGQASPVAPPAVAPPPPASPAGMTPLQSVEQHINYVTYVTHESNTSIVQNLIDNSTTIDNSSNVSVDVGGNVYGDIDLTNEVANVNATGDGAVAVGDDLKDSNINTGSGDQNVVGTINANESAVAVGGDATNTQDRSIDNSDNSVDNSTNVNVEDSFNDNSTNVNIEDSFKVDNSVDRSIDVNVQDSFNDSSTTDNSVDNSIDIDVNLGRSTDPVRSDDPGFGRGETGTGTPSDGSSVPVDYVRDGTPEQIEEKYGRQSESIEPMRERAAELGDVTGELSPEQAIGIEPLGESLRPVMPESPMESRPDVGLGDDDGMMD